MAIAAAGLAPSNALEAAIAATLAAGSLHRVAGGTEQRHRYRPGGSVRPGERGPFPDADAGDLADTGAHTDPDPRGADTDAVTRCDDTDTNAAAGDADPNASGGRVRGELRWTVEPAARVDGDQRPRDPRRCGPSRRPLLTRAPNNAFVNDTAVISDKRLDSRPILISSAAAEITFRNNYDIEFSDGTFWDGGVLEVSINGGPFVDMTDPSVSDGIFDSGPTTERSTGQRTTRFRRNWRGRRPVEATSPRRSIWMRRCTGKASCCASGWEPTRRLAARDGMWTPSPSRADRVLLSLRDSRVLILLRSVCPESLRGRQREGVSKRMARRVLARTVWNQPASRARRRGLAKRPSTRRHVLTAALP